MKTKIGHPWYWPSPRYYAYVEPNRPGAQVRQYRNQKFCVQEIASCPSITRAEKIAAALNSDEKRRAKKGAPHA